MNVNELIGQILRGEADEDLSTLATVIRQRQDQLNANLLSSLRVGDKVRLNEQTRPKRYIGDTGIVTKVNQKSALIDFSEIGKGMNVRCSMALLEKVEV